MGVNANGILSKKKSLTNLIKRENPSIVLIQETKLKRSGKFKLKGPIVQMDFNCKLGNKIIPNDPAENMSRNGKILMDIVERRDLTVVNGTEKCNGVITRKRDTIDGIEESVIDFLIVCKNVEPFVEAMIIDEKRKCKRKKEGYQDRP